MSNVTQISVLANAPRSLKSPDSITLDNGTVWTAYTNGADSTGASGHSTVVEYDASGTIMQYYQVAGYVDGLKLNPTTGEIWVLQNQDGNSQLSLINPVLQTLSAPLSYANSSSTRGFDDVVFENGKVFLSMTNPPDAQGDATIVELTNGNNPTGPLQVTPILKNGTTGLNTETGTVQVVPQADPDSLKLASNGDLLFSSGADGVIIDVHNPGASTQSVSFTQVQGFTPGSVGLDDVIKPSATSGTFYIADTKDNRILQVHVTGLNVNDYYASVGNEFAQIDPTTGIATAIVSAADAPGFTFGSSHGVEFVADTTPPVSTVTVDKLSVLASAPRSLKSPDSITLDNGTVWTAYTNGADSTGASGHSTVVEYDASGNIMQYYQVAGYVDGLKLNPTTGEIWVLQNQDGNSQLSLINPVLQTLSAPLSYANSPTTRGFDDVVFDNGKVFLSMTNPNDTSGDATIVELLNGNNPTGALLITPIFKNGTTGLNTITGTMQTVPQADPDSLKLASNGDLLFSSGADGIIIDVKNPGATNQSVSFTPIQTTTPGNVNLDDVIKPSATSGTFYIADTKDNRILQVHATGLNVNDYYASVGNEFAQIDPTTGVATAIVSSANAPGFTFGSSHGVEFVPDAVQTAPVATVDSISVLASAPSGTKSPDSITLANGDIWVAYTNGADSTGASGQSTVVEYNASGTIMQSYNVAGYVDGLKLNPTTGEIWVLQNQDGNSTLSLIDPTAKTLSAPLSYANSSSTRGFDDVVFDNGKVFMSMTNPHDTFGDATIVELRNGNNPTGPLLITPILKNGTTGLNTITGTMQTVPQADPDSLKLAPNGDLLFSSGADGIIIDVKNPGAANQSVSFTPIQTTTPGNVNLDDVIKPSATSGTFYIADTQDNRILQVHVTGLNTNDYYASVGNEFAEIDPTTGVAKALISSANAPGFTFGSSHGVEFVADPSPTAVTSLSSQLVQAMASFNMTSSATLQTAVVSTSQVQNPVLAASTQTHA
ncbi:MAG TPA: hypothetical protein VNT30_16535 [Stellaceae bacterium]|nr:hypothetical protein [Stellaceae bacterium]